MEPVWASQCDEALFRQIPRTAWQVRLLMPVEHCVNGCPGCREIGFWCPRGKVRSLWLTCWLTQMSLLGLPLGGFANKKKESHTSL